MTIKDKCMFVYIGTQGLGAGQGVHLAHLDEATGHFTPHGLAAVVDRPTWVMADPARPVLYVASEMGNAGDRIGDVMSFAIDRSAGALQPLSTIPSGGGGPTHLAIDPEGDALFVANFGGGQVAVAPIAQDGGLRPVCSVLANVGSGPHRRQQGPHAHGVTLDPSGRFLLAPDMGADRIFVYAYDRDLRALGQENDRHVALPAGAGPRLILFGKDGRFAYLLTELSAEIFVFAWDAGQGHLAPLGSVALDPEGFAGHRSAAGFAMSADGRFLYATNRTTHSIHVFAIHPEDGHLAPIQTVPAGGEKPWAVELSPTGRWLLSANQGSDNVCMFSVDAASGRLSAMPGAHPIPAPTSFAFTPASG